MPEYYGPRNALVRGAIGRNAAVSLGPSACSTGEQSLSHAPSLLATIDGTVLEACRLRLINTITPPSKAYAHVHCNTGSDAGCHRGWRRRAPPHCRLPTRGLAL